MKHLFFIALTLISFSVLADDSKSSCTSILHHFNDTYGGYSTDATNDGGGYSTDATNDGGGSSTNATNDGGGSSTNATNDGGGSSTNAYYAYLACLYGS